MSLELAKIIPPLPKVKRGVRCSLGVDPKGTVLLYANGNSVIIRNLQDESKNDIYIQHSVTVNVAKYSPSGFYIASADQSGKVRIWDTVNPEHILKYEYQPISGPIMDLDWTSDNEKMVIGGNGKTNFGAFFSVSTGSSVGTILGVSRTVNSVAFSPSRPYVAVMGDDGGSLCFFAQRPLTYMHHHLNHSSFLNVIAFCPTGACFVSGGADGKLFVYDGKTGATIEEIRGPAQGGGIYGIAFSKDGTRMVSASANKSLKLWQVEGHNITFLSEFKLPDDLGNMIHGCAWVGEWIAVVTLNSFISVFTAPPDVKVLQEPARILTGHSMPITAGAFNPRYHCLVTSSSDGSIAVWNMENGLAQMINGTIGNSFQVQDLVTSNDLLIAISLDDRCVLSNLANMEILERTKVPSQPQSIGFFAEGMLAVVACSEHLVLLHVSADKFTLVDELPIKLGSCKMTVSAETGTAVILSEGKLLCFKTHTGKFVKTTLVNAPTTPISMAKFSADGSTLALVDNGWMITVYTFHDGIKDTDLPTLTKAHSEYWQRHRARITAMCWSPNGRRLATGSLDTSIIVWSLDNPKKSILLHYAHPMSHSTSLSWLDNITVVSTAHDSSIRVWKVRD